MAANTLYGKETGPEAWYTRQIVKTTKGMSKPFKIIRTYMQPEELEAWRKRMGINARPKPRVLELDQRLFACFDDYSEWMKQRV